MVFSTPRKRATKRFYIEPHLGSVLNAVLFCLSLNKQLLVFRVKRNRKTVRLTTLMARMGRA